MFSEKNSGAHKTMNPNATREQIAEWDRMVRDLEKRSRRQMKTERECCGTCQHHRKDRNSEEWICNNEESDYCVVETEYNDYCQEHE